MKEEKNPVFLKRFIKLWNKIKQFPALVLNTILLAGKRGDKKMLKATKIMYKAQKFKPRLSSTLVAKNFTNENYDMRSNW